MQGTAFAVDVDCTGVWGDVGGAEYFPGHAIGRVEVCGPGMGF